MSEAQRIRISSKADATNAVSGSVRQRYSRTTRLFAGNRWQQFLENR